jgi:3-oxoacyl-[acyl-carrier protein] reductase
MLDLGLEGKIAIITGGSDGLGRAAAERLAAEGARVAICARRKEHLEQAAEGIRVADVSRARDCPDFVASVTAEWGGVDILNNAGTSAADAFEKVDDET